MQILYFLLDVMYNYLLIDTDWAQPNHSTIVAFINQFKLKLVKTGNAMKYLFFLF